VFVLSLFIDPTFGIRAYQHPAYSIQGWQQSFLHHNSRKDILHNVHLYLMDKTTTTESIE